MSTVDGRAVGHGALWGLALIAPLSVAGAVLDHLIDDFDGSAWEVAFGLGILAAYFLAGVAAGRLAPDAPMSNGLLAGMLAVVGWLPVRAVIELVRDQPGGLFTGDDAPFTPGRVFGALVLAAVFGLAGGLLGARMGAGGESAGWPRAGDASLPGGRDPSEERPDSTGHGAG